IRLREIDEIRGCDAVLSRLSCFRECARELSDQKCFSGHWATGWAESARIYRTRPVWPRAIKRNVKGITRHGSPLLPFRGLVTLLQSAARGAAKRQTKI